MVKKYSLFHFFWQFWKSKLVSFGELQIITLMFRCQFFELHRKSTSNFIRIQKILIVWRMSADSLLELFKGIGLSEAKAKDTVKNGNLSKNLEEAITFTQNAQISQVSQLCFLSCLSHSFTNFWVHESIPYDDFLLAMFVSILSSSQIQEFTKNSSLFPILECSEAVLLKYIHIKSCSYLHNTYVLIHWYKLWSQLYPKFIFDVKLERKERNMWVLTDFFVMKTRFTM